MARMTSTPRWITASVFLPEYPETRPSKVPTLPPIRIISRDNDKDTLEPWISRLKMSRPSLSVPKTWEKGIFGVPCGR